MLKITVGTSRVDSYCTSGGLYWEDTHMKTGDWLLGFIFSTDSYNMPHLRIISCPPCFRPCNHNHTWPAWWPAWLVKLFPGNNVVDRGWIPRSSHGFSIPLPFSWAKRLYHYWWLKRWPYKKQ